MPDSELKELLEKILAISELGMTNQRNVGNYVHDLATEMSMVKVVHERLDRLNERLAMTEQRDRIMVGTVSGLCETVGYIEKHPSAVIKRRVKKTFYFGALAAVTTIFNKTIEYWDDIELWFEIAKGGW